jgi:molecular chaperone GrpE
VDTQQTKSPEPDSTGAEPAVPAADPPPAEDVAALRAEAAKAREHWEQLLRTAAEFENFQKRVARERQETARYAFEPLLRRLVPVLDSFEMAVAATSAPASDAAAKSLRDGVGMILSQFKAALSEAGLEEVDAAGQPFDPAWHEALSQQESADVPEGRVLQQVRKGYKLRDRLLRPAGVIVSKGPAAAAGS